MRNTLRKVALRLTIPLLAALIAVNAYLVAKHLKVIQQSTAQRVEASEMLADISTVVLDLQDMETGQRGYLITGDTSYLQPYNDANGRLAAHLARLRSRLAGKAARERSLEAQVESLAQSKIAEMEETIQVRERGYRHRAFLVVSSNRGKELMDEARRTLDALSSAQAGNIARYDLEMRQSVARAVRQSVLANCILLVVTVVSLLAFHYYTKRLEVGYARQGEELRATSVKLEQFTSTIFHDLRARVEQVRSYANALLDVYGGFLPRQGQERAERIEGGAGQMIVLLDELSNHSAGGHPVEDGEVSSLEKQSA